MPLGLITGGILLLELVSIGLAWKFAPSAARNAVHPVPEGVTNTEALGRLIYTDYAFVFQASGLVLLVAMIGAIVLTHRYRPDVRRQKVAVQNARRPEDVLEIQKVSSHSGV